MKERNVQEERRKISNMFWMLVQIRDISSFLSKVHKCKSPARDHIQNYSTKAFQADQKRNLNVLIEKPQKVPTGQPQE